MLIPDAHNCQFYAKTKSRSGLFKERSLLSPTYGTQSQMVRTTSYPRSHQLFYKTCFTLVLSINKPELPSHAQPRHLFLGFLSTILFIEQLSTQHCTANGSQAKSRNLKKHIGPGFWVVRPCVSSVGTSLSLPCSRCSFFVALPLMLLPSCPLPSYRSTASLNRCSKFAESHALRSFEDGAPLHLVSLVSVIAAMTTPCPIWIFYFRLGGYIWKSNPSGRKVAEVRVRAVLVHPLAALPNIALVLCIDVYVSRD
jgi:hypothetical protein